MDNTLVTNRIDLQIQWNQLQEEKKEFHKRQEHFQQLRANDDFDRVMEEYLWYQLCQLEQQEEDRYTRMEQTLKDRLHQVNLCEQIEYIKQAYLEQLSELEEWQSFEKIYDETYEEKYGNTSKTENKINSQQN